jgi:hypothetical protein
MSERGVPWFDVMVACLLGAAAVATAWSGYQAVRWSGRQAQKYNEADGRRLDANRMAAIGTVERAVDLAMFSNWLTAAANGRTELAEFYRRRFRPEFAPAFEEWLATKPLFNPNAPPGPLMMPSYRLASDAKASQLTDEANAAAADGHESNERGDRYQLLTVTFSVVLFLAGAAPPLKSLRVRMWMLALAGLLLLYGVIRLAQYPVE